MPEPIAPKAFRTMRAARARNPTMPIIRIGAGKRALYIALGETDPVDARLTEICLITPTGHITGFVGLGHLDRLGNANWATPQALSAEALTRRGKQVRIWPDFRTATPKE